MQPKEVSMTQGDHMVTSFMIHSMLLPNLIEDSQDEVFIIEFEDSTVTNSWLNFFKPREEYDAGAYHVKKKLEDHS